METRRWSATGDRAVHSSHRQSIGLLVAPDTDVTFHFLPKHLDPIHRLDQLQKVVPILNALLVRQAPVVLLPVEYPVLGRFDEEVAVGEGEGEVTLVKHKKFKSSKEFL